MKVMHVSDFKKKLNTSSIKDEYEILEQLYKQNNVMQ